MFFTIGVLLAIGIAFFAKLAKFDRDTSFYPTVLCVIASYYVLFAFMASEAIFIESFIATLFCIVAIMGAFKAPILVGIGIFLHGVFDLVHGHFIHNPGVPNW